MPIGEGDPRELVLGKYMISIVGLEEQEQLIVGKAGWTDGVTANCGGIETQGKRSEEQHVCAAPCLWRRFVCDGRGVKTS